MTAFFAKFFKVAGKDTERAVKIIILYFTLFLLISHNTAEADSGYVSGEILVKYKTGVTASNIHALENRIGAKKIKDFKYISGLRHVQLPPDLSVEDAIQFYQNNPDVEFAEPNYYRYALARIPNDTYFDNLWGLNNTQQAVNGDTAGTLDADIDAADAWDITTAGNNVVIAVIDSGVDYNHPDLKDNIWSNPSETDNGADDDGNGYVDDIRGWDFVDNDNSPIDPYGHGTHVAGIIAAKGDNDEGVAGVAWSAKIMPLRFLDTFGEGTVADEISAINYAIAKGAKIINASYGGYGYAPGEINSENTAIAAAEMAGILFIAAAGNSVMNNDTDPVYPATHDLANIISVTATDQNDELSDFSNYGSVSVDVAAPGNSIYSAGLPARQDVWEDVFDDGDTVGWTLDAPWGLSGEALADSPDGNYADNIDITAKAPVVDLSDHSGAKLEFKLKGFSEAGKDFLYVETSPDNETWTNQDILLDSIIYTSGISGDFDDSWRAAVVDLDTFDGDNTTYFLFRFASDNSNNYKGWDIDDVKITSEGSYDGTEYSYETGTSMSAAYVSGLAALLWGFDSTLGLSDMKNNILNSVDAKGLQIVSGGRINAFNALNYMLKPSAPTDLTAAQVSSSRIDLSWTDNASNELGFKIERSSSPFVEIATVPANTVSYSDTGLSASTTYTYRVSAYNYYNLNDGASDPSGTAGDTTSAAPASDSGGGGGGGCFIATAAYGTPMAKEVKILSKFRDEHLLTNKQGKEFIKFYYKHGPAWADYIKDKESLKIIVRFGLKPIVWLAEKIAGKNSGFVTGQ